MEQEQHISPEELDLIDCYLLGRLEGAELAAFQHRLTADAALQQKVRNVSALKNGIEAFALRERMEAYHAGLAHPVPAKAAARKVIPMRRWLAAAAVLLLLLSAGWWLLRPTPNELLYTQYFRPDPGLATVMGVSDNYEFDRAMVDYKTKDYTAALKAWEPMLAKNPDSDTLNYFVGAARLANGKATESIAPLQKVAALGHSYFLDDARWYLGLALLKQGRKAEAIRYIRQSEHTGKEALLAQLMRKP